MELSSTERAKSLFQKGYEDFFNQKPREAIEKFEMAAQEHFLMAVEAYYRNTINTKDKVIRERALKKVKQAADLGSPQAALLFGSHLTKQTLVAADREAVEKEGIGYLWLASVFGESAATNLLSKIYLQKDSNSFDVSVAEDLLFIAAKQGSINASLRWAQIQVRNKDDADLGVLNEILKGLYLKANALSIEIIYKLYRDMGQVKMARIYFCVFQDVMHPGLKPLNGPGSGQVSLNEIDKLRIFNKCTNQYR